MKKFYYVTAQDVLKVLSARGIPTTFTQIMDACVRLGLCDRRYKRTGWHCTDLVREGQIHRLARGLYSI
jgi:hypothetical protein